MPRNCFALSLTVCGGHTDIAAFKCIYTEEVFYPFLFPRSVIVIGSFTD